MSDTRSLGTYLRELERLHRQLDSFLERAMVGADYGSDEATAPGSWLPAVDLFETADEYRLYAEVPGIDRQLIDLEIRDRRLILSGRRRAPEPDRGSFQLMERSHGPFRRVFELDRRVRGDEVEAKLEQGVLAIRLPKAASGARRVVVDAQEPGEAIDVDKGVR